jgi:hypothetical protein
MAQHCWTFRLFRMARRLCVFAGAGLLLALAAQGQATGGAIDDAAVPQDILTALHQMADRAGVIFVGQVIKVRRRDNGNAAAGVVEVTFEVDQAVRGCNAGSYVLREWAGLWEGDDQRYRTGQWLLMLLHAPGASRMSSPVDGMDGAIPIVRGGSVPLVANSSARVAPPAVDLRWVGTKLLRPVSYASVTARPHPVAGQTVVVTARAHDLVGGSATEATPITVLSGAASPGSASVPAQQASVDTVVGMLRSWQKAQHAVR